MFIWEASFFGLASAHMRRQQGQIINEYAITIVIVASAFIAMTVYLQRTFQAKVRDANQTMLRAVSESAPGVEVPQEYEPYYTETNSTIESGIARDTSLKDGGFSGGAGKTFRERSAVTTDSIQLAPIEGN